MLVLTRKYDEDIVATTEDGTQVRVRVVQIKGKQVRLGIIADKHTAVHRGEVLDKIESKQSSKD